MTTTRLYKLIFHHDAGKVEIEFEAFDDEFAYKTLESMMETHESSHDGRLYCTGYRVN